MHRRPLVAIAMFLLAFNAHLVCAYGANVEVAFPVDPDQKLMSGGDALVVHIRLTRQPTGNVTVALPPSMKPRSLVYSSSNWAEWQTTVISSEDNGVVDIPHCEYIYGSTASADEAFDAQRFSIVVNNIDPGYPAVRAFAQINGVERRVGTLCSRGGAFGRLKVENSISIVEGASIKTMLDLTGPTAFGPDPSFALFPLSWSNPTAKVTASQIRFPVLNGNWSQKNSVTITAKSDVVSGSTPIQYSLMHMVERLGGEDYYSAGDLTFKIFDRASIPVPVITAPAEGLLEGATSPVHVTLSSEPAAGATVSVYTSVENKQLGGVVFDATNWNVPQAVPITVLDDDLHQPGTTLNVHGELHSDEIIGYTQVSTPISIPILDNDAAPNVLMRHTNGTTLVGEAGRFDRATVVLAAKPTAPVTIVQSRAYQVGARLVSARVRYFTFTPDNWNVPQAMYVWAVDDTRREPSPHSGHIVWTARSIDIRYNGRTARLNARIVDND